MKGGKAAASGAKVRGPTGLRIIAGQWRGRKLATPLGETTRPTADRVRETAFSMLTSRLGGFSGLRVMDLFAGSGALGFEALSRGADHALLVDQDAAAIAAITANVKSLGGMGAEVWRGSALAMGRCRHGHYDLAFLDPPYGAVDLAQLLDQLVEDEWLGPGGYACVETAQGGCPSPHHWQHLVSRRAGKAELHIFRR